MSLRFPSPLERWRSLQNDAHLQRRIKFLVLAFTLGFFVVLLVVGREELGQFDNWDAYLIVCGQGFLLYPLSLGIQALCWGMMIAQLGGASFGWPDVEIYAYTNLMRRLPSPVWYLAGRTVIYRARGIGPHVTLAASGLEWLLLLLTAAILHIALSPSDGIHRLVWIIIAILIGMGGLWMVKHLDSARNYRRLPNIARRWLKSLSLITMPRGKVLAIWIVLYTIAYIIGGTILFLLVAGVAPSAGMTLIDAVRIWALTGGVGFLVSMIIPAGIGIRELTLTALLTPTVPAVEALLIAILLRMLFTVSDLVWGGLMWSIARLLEGKQKREDVQKKDEASNLLADQVTIDNPLLSEDYADIGK